MKLPTKHPTIQSKEEHSIIQTIHPEKICSPIQAVRPEEVRSTVSKDNGKDELIETIHNKAQYSRQLIVNALTKTKNSHLGCSFSIIDILTVLYHCFLDLEKIKAKSPDRDYFILSKGHAASALYMTLASNGLFDEKLLETYHLNGVPFAGHPMKDTLPGIEASTGSLGHGLPLGVGLALAAKNDGKLNKVYVLIGDGECQEGSIWEAINMAARLKLTNLTVIVDYNNLQGLDITDDIMPGSFVKKFEAFCCTVTEIDGHDYTQIINALEKSTEVQMPHVIIARTSKGKGISFIENKIEWHYRSFNPEQFAQAHEELKQP